MSEFEFRQQRGHFLQVLGKPEVVVGKLADVAPAGLLERGVAMRFAVPLAFRKREDAHAGVLLRRAMRSRDGFRRRAIANNE